jgi:hypothetical protein
VPQGTECAAARMARGSSRCWVADVATQHVHVNTSVDLTALMQGDAKEIALRVCPGEEVG